MSHPANLRKKIGGMTGGIRAGSLRVKPMHDEDDTHLHFVTGGTRAGSQGVKPLLDEHREWTCM